MSNTFGETRCECQQKKTSRATKAVILRALARQKDSHGVQQQNTTPLRRLGGALGGALGGEMYRKRRAFPRLAFYLDASAVILDDALADRQS